MDAFPQGLTYTPNMSLLHSKVPWKANESQLKGLCVVHNETEDFLEKCQLVSTICSISIIMLVCTAPSGLFLLFTHNLKTTRVVSQDCPLPWIAACAYAVFTFMKSKILSEDETIRFILHPIKDR